MDLKRMKKQAEKLKDPIYFTKLLYGYDNLSPKQEELLRNDAMIEVDVAGRRFGKSELNSAKALRRAVMNPKTKTLIAGPSLDQATIYYDVLTEALEESALRGFLKSVKISPFPTIYLKNGSEITFRSTAYNGKYMRGRKKHYIYLTEAAFIKDKIYDEVVKPMQLDTNAKIVLESTPFGMNYFYKEYQKGLRDKTGFNKSFHGTVYDNPIISKMMIEKLRKEVPGYVWKQEYLGEFVDDDSNFFKYDLILKIFEDYKVTKIYDRHRKYKIGADIAKYNDYTVIVVMDITEKPYKIVEKYRFNQRLYDEVISIINDLQSKYNCQVNLDATGVGDPVSEKINSCNSFVFSQKSKSELLHNFLLLAEKEYILLPSSWIDLRDEMRYFKRFKSGSGFKLEAQQGYHDDTVMAVALSLLDSQKNTEVEVAKIQSNTFFGF